MRIGRRSRPDAPSREVRRPAPIHSLGSGVLSHVFFEANASWLGHPTTNLRVATSVSSSRGGRSCGLGSQRRSRKLQAAAALRVGLAKAFRADGETMYRSCTFHILRDRGASAAGHATTIPS